MKSGNLTHEIVRDLGAAIVAGKYRTGEPFPIESELSAKYGVSRSILREAVKMLTAKGMLSSRPRRGTWVEPESNWNLLDPDLLNWMLESKSSLDLVAEFIEIRMQIEPAAAALAAERASDAHIQEIMIALERMEEAEKGNDDPLQSDIAFHVSVLQASENRFFGQMRHLVATALRVSIRLTNQYKGVRQANVADHRLVAEAIAARKPDEARQHMLALIKEALALIRRAQAAS
jgi:DNA-binding FadR family transcriptional regulator